MYVCLCNGFTDRQVKAVAAQVAGSAAAVYRCLGVQPKCGKCVPMVRQMIQSAAVSSGAADCIDGLGGAATATT